jgi:hypothetical protein
MSTYQYTPLNTRIGEIRLLKLHPGAFDDPIKITIFTTPFVTPQPRLVQEDRLEKIRGSLSTDWDVHENLEGRIFFWKWETQQTAWDHPDPEHDRTSYETDAQSFSIAEPAFEALSYTWGSDETQQVVQVVPLQRSGNRGSQISVRRNVYDALTYLRDCHTPRTLWIDAICINQKDLTERNLQVNRMGDIFHYAQRVVVWLGLASFDSALALRVLSRMGDQVEYSKSQFLFPAPDHMVQGLYTNTYASYIDSDPETWYAVHDLICRPWFYRLWIVQEIVLANPSALIQCGKDVIQWRQLRRAITACFHMNFPRGSPRSLRARFMNLYGIARGSIGQNPLVLLHDATYASCSDPRDKVFALLGLFPPALSQTIQPSYEQSPQEVYREAFVAYVGCSEKLDILALSGPSWIPDWSISKGTTRLEGFYCSSNSIAAACCSTSDVLMATGVLYDTIKAVSGPLPPDDSGVLEAVSELWLEGASCDQTYPTDEPLAEACAWTINSGGLSDKWPGFVSYPTSVAEARRPFLPLKENETPGTAPQFRTQSNTFVFKTLKGYFGLTLRETMPGDKISVLLGCSTPTILREDLKGNHLFVGCAYVHGIMDGEVLLGSLPYGYEVINQRDDTGDVHQEFIHTVTGVETDIDPRLGPLPADWEPTMTNDRLWPTKKVHGFRNKNTGEIMHSDPRLLPYALRARGVPLEEFALV